MTNKKSVEGRKRYEENLNKLFDISHPDVEKNLAEDRIRREGGRKSEDLQFLEDQRGPRKMKMGNLDEEFQKKKTAQLKRKLGQVLSSTVTSNQLPNILSEDQMNEYLGDSSPIKEGRTDEEFNIKEMQARRSDYITVQLQSPGKRYCVYAGTSGTWCQTMFCSPSPVTNWRMMTSPGSRPS